MSPPGQNSATSSRTASGTSLGERVEGRDAGDEHGRRRGALAALGVEEALHGGGVERVGGDAVDGVGGDDDELAAADGAAGEAHAGEQLGVDRAVVDGSHDRSILVQRPVPRRARAARRGAPGGGVRIAAADAAAVAPPASVSVTRSTGSAAARLAAEQPRSPDDRDRRGCATHQPSAPRGVAHRRAHEQPANRLDDGRDRLVLGDPLQPVGHRLDRHERAREVRQEQQDEAVAARRLGARRREADRREQVGDREDVERDEAERGEPLERRRPSGRKPTSSATPITTPVAKRLRAGSRRRAR